MYAQEPSLNPKGDFQMTALPAGQMIISER